MILAARLSGLKIEFIDAVTTSEIDRRIVPPPADPTWNMTDPEKFNDKVFASWRSHVNAIQIIVDQDLGSALILEDDADWDVRLKSQLRDWALATRQLLQPLKHHPDQFLDPTYQRANLTQYDQKLAKGLTYKEWDWASPPAQTLDPTDCAYGDLHRWDVLWAGHCGQEFPIAGEKCPKVPLGRVAMYDDPSVVQTQHFANYWSLHDYQMAGYDNHTRVTSWSCAQVCNIAYAVSNQGAQKLLYDFGIRSFGGMTDRTLRDICSGNPPFELRTCLSVTPQIFNQYARKGPHPVITPNIRWSTSKNLGKLVNGQTDYIDSYPNNSSRPGHPD